MQKQIEQALMVNSSVFAVNLGNIAKNYHYIANKIPNSLIFPAIKANSYGIGAKQVANRLIKEGCKGFFVFTHQEAVDIYPQENDVKIYILGPELNDINFYNKYPKAIPVLYKNTQVNEWIAKNSNKEFAIQVETGLNRQGVDQNFLLNTIKNNSNINIGLVISHLACASYPESSYNKVQLQDFKNLVSKLPKNIKTSLSATYSMFEAEEYNFNVVRPGIALFGGKPNLNKKNEMLSVAYLYGKILQIHHLKKGEKAGYDATEATKDTILATVSMGYADGILRNAGKGKSYLNINGHKAKIFGVVSMDTTTIDVTDIPAELVYEGAIVEFYGKHVQINEIATTLNDNPCNIIIHAGLRAKRIYID